MIESHLQAGNQKIPNNLNELKYGISITDACIDWETTRKTLKDMHAKLFNVLPYRQT
jgi:3-deoxy-7-phosphoheptulonate synthase